MKKVLLFFLLALSVWGSLKIYFFLQYRSPESATIYFERGSSLRSISKTLADHRLTPDPLLFEMMARLQRKGNRLKAGEYEFKTGLGPLQLMDMMVRGDVKLYSLTIPEGWNLKDIGKIFVEKGLLSPEEASPLTADLEGYLFPDTYFYERRHTAKDIVAMMAELFRKKITPDLIEQAFIKGLSLHQWVTLASIIEKETALPEERPVIASVFLNRLKMGMPLQTDPSVIYGITDFDGNLTKRHLETDTPYNTYTRTGLPKGPISSPGMEALLSILHPAETDYLYFVAKGNSGEHQFSKTLEEHNKAVNDYQRNIGSPPVP